MCLLLFMQHVAKAVSSSLAYTDDSENSRCRSRHLRHLISIWRTFNEAILIIPISNKWKVRYIQKEAKSVTMNIFRKK